MTQNRLHRWWLVGCVFIYCVFSARAQTATPNPIFVPLNPTEISDETSADEENVTSSPSNDDSITVTQASDEFTNDDAVSIEKHEHHVLKRPIELRDDKVHWVDRTYPYGSTQWDTKEVHLGVEFVNKRFTPVFSSEAGEVVFAGADVDVLIGPYENYYGYVVVIAHEILSLDDKPVFTLYGHLDRVEVETGEIVTAGQRIGRVGSSGIALGAHLHFEVRVDDPFDYTLTRNPELWLQHYVDHGLIAGFVHDAEGNSVMGQRLVVRSDTVNREIFTYGSDRVNSDPVWQENFTVGDLPADDYEIVMLDSLGRVAFRDTVTVEAYQTTFVDILLAE